MLAMCAYMLSLILLTVSANMLSSLLLLAESAYMFSYGDYKFRKIIGKTEFSDQFKKRSYDINAQAIM